MSGLVRRVQAARERSLDPVELFWRRVRIGVIGAVVILVISALV
ncbi:hypothetical protein SAMN05216257_10480 [Meinhardsimonia xiamenensis]|jgi:hypothetical protein|uniref:Uncharacterized protein n=1 Tax=Meinhardsimonia xiamenensis TaxID=990712 RepID=A0A1G9DYS7_9RHOB|nr:hypothetical protein [Meinhardsimonia xiamenensis]PRX28999.1 hypothetical protein LV81_02943 [Meinhardsimonia xiamenensis]SDK69026.1 hypothetical protein SAMN05216257_10480 [Meinhardsimonia xiamenensis]